MTLRGCGDSRPLWVCSRQLRGRDSCANDGRDRCAGPGRDDRSAGREHQDQRQVLRAVPVSGAEPRHLAAVGPQCQNVSARSPIENDGRDGADASRSSQAAPGRATGSVWKSWMRYALEARPCAGNDEGLRSIFIPPVFTVGGACAEFPGVNVSPRRPGPGRPDASSSSIGIWIWRRRRPLGRASANSRCPSDARSWFRTTSSR